MNIPSIFVEYKKESHRIHESCILLEDVKEKLSSLVSRRIRELGLTNAEVARRSSLSRGYIGNIVNETAPTQSGQYNLSPEAVTALAKALEISESEILSAMDYLKDSPRDLPIFEYLKDIEMSVFDENDYREIADYINYRAAKKRMEIMKQIEPQQRVIEVPSLDSVLPKKRKAG